MPLKLKAPRRSPYWSVKGTYLGVRIDRSTKTGKRAIAAKILKQIEHEIECNLVARPGEPTFAGAAAAYMKAGGENVYLTQIIQHFGNKLLREIDQAAIDNAAMTIMPHLKPSTRNREVYTPISAVLNHVGAGFRIKRPKGAHGTRLMGWLRENEAFSLLRECFMDDPEFGVYVVVLLYTGCRMSEPLKVKCDDVNLASSELFVPDTKNGEPRRVFLPVTAITALANHPRGLDRPGEPLFKFKRSRRWELYTPLKEAAIRAGVTFPPRQKFHLFRHTFGTWLRRYAQADVDALLATGAWKSASSARRYMHMDLEEESKRAIALPAWKISGE
jgi:integrase